MADTILYFLLYGQMKAIITKTPIISFSLYLIKLPIFHRRRKTETVKKEGSKSSSNGRLSHEQILEPRELAEMNVEDLMKYDLEISSRNL